MADRTARVRRPTTRYETNGSLAYQYGYAPERRPQREPERHVRTRSRSYVRPGVQTREPGQVSIFAVVGFALIGALVILLLMSCIQLMTTADRTVALKKELTALGEENVRLLAQYELAYDLKAIEQTMLQTGTMVKPQSGQIVVLDLSAPDSVVVFDDEETGFFAGIAAGAKELLSPIGE